MSIFDENIEPDQPGYHAPVPAVKREPLFTTDADSRPFAISSTPAGSSHRKRAVRQARDGAQYMRQQRGHSLELHLLLGAVVLWIPAIYITVSPNHYWHI